MNRGSTSTRCTAPASSTCFNEAPIHESGKSCSRNRAHSGEYCFNEAPIHESGKFPSAQDDSIHRAGFNEAPIHESGKSRYFHLPMSSLDSASMRPRFMNRGSR